jgi:2-phospho-L-lactate guanylyltransferase
MTLWTIIPVKPLSDVKRRLAGVLAAEERACLIEQFLRHELVVLQEAAAGRTLVVSSDAAVARLAAEYGADVLHEETADGLNAAVTRGLAEAQNGGASAVLILPVDLPFLSVMDVALLLQAAQAGAEISPGQPQMVICADKAGEGTNALLLAPPVAFTFHYGAGSFRRHQAEAARRGLHCRVAATAGLSFDLDTEADWLLYLAESAEPC